MLRNLFPTRRERAYRRLERSMDKMIGLFTARQLERAEYYWGIKII